jgi:UDP-glucose 4-epimerase
VKVLITGVAGMIGARLADWIAENHPEVELIGIDDLSGGYLENINPKVQFYKQNLADDISAIFEREKPDVVYHLAAYAAEGLSPFVRVFNYQNNLIATTRVITQCIKHGVKRLVYTSSMSVYGRGKTPFDERDQQAPIDPYGVAKYAAEMDIKIAHEQHGLEYCIIRPHNVYGAKQNIWDKYRNVLGIWMFRLMNSEPISIFGDGEQKRAFSYIDDITEPLWNAAIRKEAAGEIINLGGIS